MLNKRGARSIVSEIVAGEITATEVTSAYLVRIAEREPEVQAWAHLDRVNALRQADALDRGPIRGPLHGIPVGVKDIIDTSDLPSEYGSPIYAGYRPRADASCVAVLRAAGAIVLGKTVTTEFATSHPGPTRHPQDPKRTPGGSSSGSAAAVADKMTLVALGTQTMGSVIRPAAYCGIVGYKPSFGLINRAGIKPQAESLDTVGILARSIDDAALVGSVLFGAPSAFTGALARPPRIALYRGSNWNILERAANDALNAATDRLSKYGAVITDAGSPAILSAALDAQLKIVGYELARALAYEWDNHREKLSSTLCDLIQYGFAVPFDDYLDAQNTAFQARQWIAASFAQFDLWLTASAPGEAPQGLSSTGDPVLNRLWSLLHLPVLTLPFGRGPAALPLGIQLVGPFRADAHFLQSARWIEAALIE